MSISSSTHPKTQESKNTLPARLFDRLAKVIDETDESAAAERVARLQTVYPGATPEELTERLIYHKCRDTAVVGASTSGVALIPGLGTIASLTLGIAADFGITFKMQAELVLEIATVYSYEMTPEEKRRVVLMVTGLSAGTTAVAHRAGNNISKRVTTRVASKYVTKAVPFVGMAASASTNALMTYFIGKRAQAYFSLGPEAMQDWSAILPAVTGLNRENLAAGAKAGGQAMVKVGGVVANGARSGTSRVAGKARTTFSRKSSTAAEDEIIPVFDKP
ncbi:MAG: DUF697 domain-containing protein [Anaerolineae bacterium]|nr:DUF697 domain-containing protein [Anaerolineae bacterium]